MKIVFYILISINVFTQDTGDVQIPGENMVNLGVPQAEQN